MSENTRPVLDINIDESRLKRMEEVVQKFQAALQIGPGGRPVVSPGGMPSVPDKKPVSPGGTTTPWGREIGKLLGGLDKSAQGTLKTFGLVNKTLDTTQKLLKGLFSSTIRWSARLGLLSTGGLFGYDVMARHVAAQYRTAQGNNMTTGQMQAAQNVYGTRFSGTGSIIQGLTNAQNNPSDPAYAALLSLGINPADGAGANLPALLSRAASLLKGYKNTGVSQAALQSMGLGGMFDVNTANQIAANSGDIPRLNAMFGVQSKQLDKDMGAGTQKSFQDLSGNLSNDADRILNSFLSAVAKLNKPIGDLTDELTADIETFLKGGNGKAVFDTVADGLERLGAWLSGPEFQKDLSDFEKDIRDIASAVRDAIHWFDRLTGKDDESKKADQPAGPETNSQAIAGLMMGTYATPWDMAKAAGHTAGVIFDNSALAPMRNRAVANAQKNKSDAERAAASTPRMVNPNDRHALNVLKSHVADANYKSGLPAGMLPAVAGAESGWDFRAISAAGAGGLFQFTKDTASRYGLSDADRFNPDKSTQAASRYFQDNLRRYHGDIAETLAQYNGGNVAVNKDGNLNVKLETIRYLEKLLPQIRGGEEQHTGLMGRLRAAEQQLNGNRDQRVTVQLDINHNPGADINASVQSQYIPH